MKLKSHAFFIGESGRKEAAKLKTIVKFLASFLIITSLGCSLTRGENRFAEGINIGGVEINNLSRAEAEKKLQLKAGELLNRQLSFVYKQERINARLADLGVSTNLIELLDRVYGHQGKGLSQSVNLELELRLDIRSAAEKVRILTQGLNNPPKDAVLRIKPDNSAEVITHAPGIQVDVDKTVEQLKLAVDKGTDSVIVAVKELEPAVKSKDLEAQKPDTLLAAFATGFSAKDLNRTENLKTAAQAIDMLVIKPGETFSFNDIVGPRTQESGYKEAPIIVNNELVPGIGGGVCQVSSTLYNLALLGDLQILERHPHEFAIAYLPPGRDAMVVEKRADLRFKNNTSSMLLVRTQVKGSKLNMQLYGKKNNKQVEIQTVIEDRKPFEIERRFDPSLPPGHSVQDQAGAQGYSTRTLRIVKVNKQEIKREEISKDFYKPAKKIFRVGPPTNRGAAIY